MPCAKRMLGCHARCAHRVLVRDYHAERERQQTAIENQTEREPDEFDVVVFKDWLIAHKRER